MQIDRHRKPKKVLGKAEDARLRLATTRQRRRKAGVVEVSLNNDILSDDTIGFTRLFRFEFEAASDKIPA
jgi:hypothetical protein